MSKNSLASLSEQILRLNTTITEILVNLTDLVQSKKENVEFQIPDSNGTRVSISLPTVGHLKAKMDSLNSAFRTIQGLDANGSILQLPDGSNQKILRSDLNQEPNSLSELNKVDVFQADPNWFFDGLLDPILSVKVDLKDKISSDTSKIQSLRYIVNFNVDEGGVLTPQGTTAKNAFVNNWKGKIDIDHDLFLTWLETTPGVQIPIPDLQIFNLEPNKLIKKGVFDVSDIVEDTLNSKLWYHLNTLQYLDIETGNVIELKVNDQLILNKRNTSSRWKIIEIDSSGSVDKIRLESVEGFETIPVAISSLKIYSQPSTEKSVKISIGYNEYNVIFLKSINSNNILAENWSKGVSFYSGDLLLSSTDSNNGTSMQDYYVNKVFDYGEVLRDLVAKKIPSSLGETPVAPILDPENFKVVQVNKHLTDIPDAKKVRQLHSEKNTLKSELESINLAIQNKETEIQRKKFRGDADKRKAENELKKLTETQESKSKRLNTVIKTVLEQTQSLPKTKPKFRARGFWQFPEGLQSQNTRNQEIVQFIYRYKYSNLSGAENPTEGFKVKGVTTTTGTIAPQNAFFSEWIQVFSDVRKRTFNETTGLWEWVIEDVSDADTPNINQFDQSISPGERIELQVKSVSEVGFPESPVHSDWSESIIISFPDDLNNVLSEDDFILKEASQEEARIQFEDELQTRGVNIHIEDSTNVGDSYFAHKASRINSEMKDPTTGLIKSLFDWMRSVQSQLDSIEERLSKAQGELQVVLLRGTKEFKIKNGSTSSYTLIGEEYGELSGATSRIYKNDVYIAKEFTLLLENIGSGPLELFANPDKNAVLGSIPADNEPIFFLEDSGTGGTGISGSQLPNQWIWLLPGTGNYYFKRPAGLLASDASDILSQNFSTGGPILTIGDGLVSYKGTLDTDFVGDGMWTGGSANTPGITLYPVLKNSYSEIVESSNSQIKYVPNSRENSLTIPIWMFFKFNLSNSSTFNAASAAVTGSPYSNSTKSRVLEFYLQPGSGRDYRFKLEFKFKPINQLGAAILSSPIN